MTALMDGGVTERWTKARHMLLPALELCAGRYTEDDVVKGLLGGEYVLFANDKAAALLGAHLYPNAQAPRVKELHYFLVGGDMDELKAMQPEIEAFAKAIGCNQIGWSGRRGWLRVLTDYKELCTVAYKELT